jgi:PAS domain-containing protein
MERFKAILLRSEDWLMDRVLEYAKRRGYTAYTSTLREAWRLSISGLSASIIQALNRGEEVPELTPAEDLSSDPVTQFGIVEAQRHRERGVELGMFLGLMKYYRQAYQDLVREPEFPAERRDWASLFLDRVFDRIEIVFCVEWALGDQAGAFRELQISNRMMTNEKNRYLTIFESVSLPLILLSEQNRVENMNLAAARMFQPQAAPGSQYYCLARDRQLEAEYQEEHPEGPARTCFSGRSAESLMPWLKDELEEFAAGRSRHLVREKEVIIQGGKVHLSVSLSRMLDVSGKFEGCLLALEDITRRKEEEKSRLRGERLAGVLEMAGAAAHEISQPMQTLVFAFENLLHDNQHLRATGEADYIQKALDRMLGLFQKIQRITRYETMDYSAGKKIIDVEKASRSGSGSG